MLFSSLEFIFIFLAGVFFVYFLCPRRFRNLALLIASLIFYALGEPIYLFLMLFCALIAFICGILIERFYNLRRFFLTFGVIILLAALIFFKYASPLMLFLGLDFPSVRLPVGISFYTFQALSYIIDIYRGDRAEKSPIDFFTYLTMFPQLIAGPIVKYSDISLELKGRRESFSQAARGIILFSVGLSKKAILADSLGALSLSFSSRGGSVLGLWAALIFFALQIYYDFSGYSDMAVGLGLVFGFNFPRNFDYPYISGSITEFWRRWHITLSSWFKEYLYIPLGGNRRGRWRTYFNLFTVWSLTGLWHGAAVNFILWGIYFFILLVIEKAFLLKLLKRCPRFLCHVYAFAFILFGWFIFSTESSELISRGLALFGFSGLSVFSSSDLYDLLRTLPLFFIACAGATPLPRRLFERLSALSPRIAPFLRNALAILGIFLSCAYLTADAYSPFLYFRF